VSCKSPSETPSLDKEPHTGSGVPQYFALYLLDALLGGAREPAGELPQHGRAACASRQSHRQKAQWRRWLLQVISTAGGPGLGPGAFRPGPSAPHGAIAGIGVCVHPMSPLLARASMCVPSLPAGDLHHRVAEGRSAGVFLGQLQRCRNGFLPTTDTPPPKSQRWRPAAERRQPGG